MPNSQTIYFKAYAGSFKDLELVLSQHY